MSEEHSKSPSLPPACQDQSLLKERIADFIAQGGGRAAEDTFENLARAAFSYQYERVEAYRRLCDGRGRTPGSVRSWQEVPAVPAAAFKAVKLAAAPAKVVFRSSGTTRGSGRRSEHHQPFPELYRRAMDLSFPQACLAAEAPLPILSLIPPLSQVPDSSLSYMAGHVLATWGDGASATAFGPRGVIPAEATAWAREAERRGRPVLVLATAFALLQWLDALEEEGRTLRLPEGSTLFETGGFKGRTREVSREELLRLVAKHLGLPRSRAVREYGMTELSSQFYTAVLQGGDGDLFFPPPWTRVRILDPETQREAPPGRAGLATVFDLANLGSAAHVMTEDLGVAEGRGFRLLGRATGAELRGCSLTVEELAG